MDLGFSKVGCWALLLRPWWGMGEAPMPAGDTESGAESRCRKGATRDGESPRATPLTMARNRIMVTKAQLYLLKWFDRVQWKGLTVWDHCTCAMQPKWVLLQPHSELTGMLSQLVLELNIGSELYELTSTGSAQRPCFQFQVCFYLLPTNTTLLSPPPLSFTSHPMCTHTRERRKWAVVVVCSPSASCK